MFIVTYINLKKIAAPIDQSGLASARISDQRRSRRTVLPRPRLTHPASSRRSHPALEAARDHTCTGTTPKPIPFHAPA